MNVSNLEYAPGAVPTGELVKQTVDGARDLVQIEIALALDEVREDVAKLKKVAVWSGVGLVLSNLLLSTLVLSIVLVLGGTAEIAFAATGVLALLVVVVAIVAVKLFPGVPLKRTRERVKNNLAQLKERVA